MKNLFTLLFAFFGFFVANAQTVILSELADPNDNASCRFVEIHCEGPMPCDMAGYELRRWTNGNASTTTSIDLSSLGTLPVSGNAVIANNAMFTTCYGFAADIVAGSGGPVDSNGDDQIGLFDNTGTLVDIFGVPGEDGSNTCHEFEDGRAVRISSVTSGNTTWDDAEWDVWADTEVMGCASHTNLAQNVADMNPGQSALPIELMEFEVKLEGAAALITWSTGLEINNSHFEVLKSTDGVNFEVISRIQGAGFSVEELHYSFLDNELQIGMNHYKLKQVDFDNRSETFGMKSVKIADESEVVLFPTAAQNEISIKGAKEGALIAIYNMNGQVVKQVASDNIAIDVSDLQSGNYIVRINDQVLQFVKL